MLSSVVENLQNYKVSENAFLLHQSEVYKLNNVNTMGNDESCNIRVTKKTIASRHCRIIRKNEKFVINDLNSKSGTYVNDTKVIEAELNNGDILKLGDFEFVFSFSPLLNTHSKNSLTSKNKEWNDQLKQLSNYAKNDFPILIHGQSGTGKDIIAKAIHEESERSHENFVCINCSALSSQLIESELFGHIKGSFTGAERDRKGAFVEAKKGTLFLDEIGDLPLDLQPKLLRAIENQEIKPVGSDQCIKTNVRIITATHKSLKELVKKGDFREDLYFRLNVLELTPPSLKNRLEDFNDLFYIFAKKYRIRFDFNAIESLKKHSWPGNIRELKNFIIKASVYYKGSIVTEEKVKDLFAQQGILLNATPPLPEICQTSLLKKQEFDTIFTALKKYNGNQRKAAFSIGMPTSTMNDRVKKYNINLKSLKKPVTKIIF